MKRFFHPAGLIGFLLTTAFCLAGEWSLQEFCWSTWLAGLVFSWACIVTAAAQILLTGGNVRERLKTVDVFGKVPPVFLIPAIPLAAGLTGYIAINLYSYLFGFYGLFLSVFAEMEPHSLFGRNGFINSDFFTPVTYLVQNFWPMALGNLIASSADLLRGDPWKRFALPFRSEGLRMHLMVLALPFLSLLAWAIFGTAYQQVTIVLITAIFFLLPKHGKQEKEENGKEGQQTESGAPAPVAPDR